MSTTSRELSDAMAAEWERIASAYRRATPIINSPCLAPLASAYMRIELIEWLRASEISLIDLLSSYAIARRGSRSRATEFLEEMGLASMPWEKSFAAWLMEYPTPERHPASMEFEYIELLGRILKANHNNSKT